MPALVTQAFLSGSPALFDATCKVALKAGLAMISGSPVLSSKEAFLESGSQATLPAHTGRHKAQVSASLCAPPPGRSNAASTLRTRAYRAPAAAKRRARRRRRNGIAGDDGSGAGDGGLGSSGGGDFPAGDHWDGSWGGGSSGSGAWGGGGDHWGGGGSGWWRSNYSGEPWGGALYDGMWLWQLLCCGSMIQALHFLIFTAGRQGQEVLAAGAGSSGAAVMAC